MKRIIAITIGICAVYFSNAQTTLNSGQAAGSNLNAPASAQPVPNATVTERSATTAKPLIATAANPVPPIYPGGDVRAVETNNNLIFPASSPSPTQPIQREPLTPVESTNVLQPTRPQREENSRVNTATGVQVQATTGMTTTNRQATTTTKATTATRPKPTTAITPTTATTPVTTVSSKDNIAMKMDGSVRTSPAVGVSKTTKKSVRSKKPSVN